MPLKVIAQDQVEEVTYGDATFRVHVRGCGWWDALNAKYAGTGDADGYRAEWVRGTLVGWVGLIDKDDAAIEYSEDAAPAIYDSLPHACGDLIWRTARGRLVAASEAVGN